MRNTSSYLVILFLILSLSKVMGQDRMVSIANNLENLELEMPGLTENVELSVNGVSIEEFIRGIAVTNKLNISVDPSLDTKIINNFSNVSVSDVLLFLAKEHNLDLKFTGNIISITRFVPPPSPIEKPPPPKPGAVFNTNSNSITLDYSRKPLSEVAREITVTSGKNVLVSQGIEDKAVSGYIKDMPFFNALEKFALTNGLILELTADNFYLFKEKGEEVERKEVAGNGKRKLGNSLKSIEQQDGLFEYEVNSVFDITLYAKEVPIADIIQTVSDELGIGYYVNSTISGTASIFIHNTSYEALLGHLLNASNFTFQQVGEIYVIGEREIEKLRETRVIQLQHRSLENVVENIPAAMANGVTIKEFPDLNSLILSGSKPNIEEIALFIRQIDKVVPVVLIEVMLIDYTTDRTVSAGVRVGVAEEPAGQSKGSLYPELKYDFNSQSVNNLIDNFNGNGFLNLGKVTPNFYMSINALEEQGMLKVRSTPKLATLNGTEATLSIGNTEYYAVQSRNFVGSQVPLPVVTKQFQSINADLSVTIKPFVSGDDQITLEIKVEQSDFTGRVTEDAPPGSVTRSFSSFLRVKNEEMILLGGLEQKSVGENGTGIPLLSRIPVLKWLFSNRSKTKSKSKLNIFIKPTVLY